MLARCPDADLAVAIAAAHAGTEPPPVRPDPVRDARPEEPVSPVETLDVLVETLLHVVDGKVHYTSTAERALDGLAALHAARPHDFALLVGSGPWSGSTRSSLPSSPPRAGTTPPTSAI